MSSFLVCFDCQNDVEYNFKQIGVCFTSISKGVLEKILFLIIVRHAPCTLVDAALGAPSIIVIFVAAFTNRSCICVSKNILPSRTRLGIDLKQTPNCYK